MTFTLPTFSSLKFDLVQLAYFDFIYVTTFIHNRLFSFSSYYIFFINRKTSLPSEMEIEPKMRKLENSSNFGLLCSETGKLFSLIYGFNIIGRKKDNRIHTKCVFSSKVHATIEVTSNTESVTVSDLSLHGTHIDRPTSKYFEFIHKQRATIFAGDILIIGFHSYTLINMQKSMTVIEVDD